MADQFLGKWKLAESENFDEYMKSIGIGFLTRTAGMAAKPVLEFALNDGKWHVVSTSTFKTVVMDYEMDKQFEETTPDGRLMNSTITLKDGKMTQTQKKIKDKDKDSTIERYIENGRLVTVCTSEDGVVSKRIYDKM